MTVIDLKNKLPEELEALSADNFVMVQEGDQIMDEKFQTKPIGFFKDAMIRLSKNKVALLSFFIIVAIILGAYIVPAISGYTYTEYVLEARNLPPKVPGLEKLGICDGTRVLENRRVDGLEDKERYPEGCVLEIRNKHTVKGVEMCDVVVDTYKMAGLADDVYHWMGTDDLGRDTMTRLFRGTRVSLLIAFITVLTNVFIGVVYGAVSGYYGGKVDVILTHVAQVLDGLPYVCITVLFMLVLGAGMGSIILADRKSVV